MSVDTDLALAPLDAAWSAEHGIVRLLLRPIGAEADATPAFELVFLGGELEERKKLAENFARRLSRDLSSLPPR